MIKSILFYLLGLNIIFSLGLLAEETFNPTKDAALQKENRKITAEFEKIEKLYELDENEKYREITDKVLASPSTSEESKNAIRTYNRRVFVFKYPSDHLWIKGFISFTPNPNHHPLLVLYRWGNGKFALMNPGVIFATYKDYTVISSTLRGGISEGTDEFGGDDVDDMKNLMDFIPQLAQELGIELHPSCVFMLGPSRGGMQMFLTLAHFPELQDRVNKVVSLSSILDLHQLIRDRPNDMKVMLERQFGLQEGAKGEAWIAKRDPLNTVPHLKQSLPILIIQGTADNRINLAEGHHMVDALKQTDHQVDYWEIKNGNHALMNTPYIMNDIAHWLESNSPCMSIHLPRH
jgi:dipeptidyl aminopeptidase/acylaminoacyl peptidase